MSNLVPTPITDKNGRLTTVHRKPENGSVGRVVTVGAPPAQQGVQLTREDINMAWSRVGVGEPLPLSSAVLDIYDAPLQLVLQYSYKYQPTPNNVMNHELIAPHTEGGTFRTTFALPASVNEFMDELDVSKALRDRVMGSFWYEDTNLVRSEAGTFSPSMLVKLALHYELEGAGNKFDLPLYDPRACWISSPSDEVDLWRASSVFASRSHSLLGDRVHAVMGKDTDPVTFGEYVELIRRYPAAFYDEDAKFQKSAGFTTYAPVFTLSLCHPYARKNMREYFGKEWLAWLHAFNMGRTNARDPDGTSLGVWRKEMVDYGFTLEEAAPYLYKGINRGSKIAAALDNGIDVDLLTTVFDS